MREAGGAALQGGQALDDAAAVTVAADAQLTLDADDLAKLDEVSALPPEYPGWMLSRQGAARIPQPFTPKG